MMKKTLFTPLSVTLLAFFDISCIRSQHEKVAQEDSLQLPQEEQLLDTLQDSLSLSIDSLLDDSVLLSSDSLPLPVSSKL